MKRIKEKQAEIEGKIINFVDEGKGEPIVFIHGSANNWRTFWPVAKYLKDKHRVILMDLPGFGKSDRLTRYSMRIEAEWIKKLTDRLKLKKICLAGSSMGAGVALKFGQMYPKKLKKMILISAIYKRGKRRRLVKAMDRFYETASRRVARQKIVKKISQQRFFSYLTTRFFNMRRFKKGLVDKYVIRGKRQMDARAYVQMNRAMIKMRMRRLMKKIKKPVLIICGGEDRLTECGLWTEATKEKRDWAVKEVKGAGHLVIWERPKTVAEMMDRFTT